MGCRKLILGVWANRSLTACSRFLDAQVKHLIAAWALAWKKASKFVANICYPIYTYCTEVHLTQWEFWKFLELRVKMDLKTVGGGVCILVFYTQSTIMGISGRCGWVGVGVGGTEYPQATNQQLIWKSVSHRRQLLPWQKLIPHLQHVQIIWHPWLWQTKHALAGCQTCNRQDTYLVVWLIGM